MTHVDAAEVQRLIQEGRAAALAGDSFAARSAFRRATELDTESAEAWIGLSSVVPILHEKLGYLQRALVIAPEHAEARMSVAYVEKLIADGMQIAPSQRTYERHASGDSSPLLATAAPEATPTAETLFCYIHPDRETGLRCVQCTRPICGQCAKPAAVGQLCPECRKERRPTNYKVEPRDLALISVTAIVVALLISGLLSIIPGFGIFISIGAGWLGGVAIVRAVDRVTRTKRGRSVQIVTGIGIAIGVLLGGMLVISVRVLASAEVQTFLAANPGGGSQLIGIIIGAVLSNTTLLIFAVVAVIVAMRQLR